MSCNESNVFSKGREGEGGTRCDSQLCPTLSWLAPTAPGGTVLLPRRLLFLAESGGQPAYFTVVSCSWQSPVKAARAVPYIARPVSYCSGISIGSCKVADPNRLYRRSAVEVQSFSDKSWPVWTHQGITLSRRSVYQGSCFTTLRLMVRFRYFNLWLPIPLGSAPTKTYPRTIGNTK